MAGCSELSVVVMRNGKMQTKAMSLRLLYRYSRRHGFVNLRFAKTASNTRLSEDITV